MKLIGLLCFYDEPVKALKSCIASMARAGVDTLVAVDGAYAMYDGEPWSHQSQHTAIQQTCAQYGIGCLTYKPPTIWQDNERGKRGFMFGLALMVAEHGDWFWVMDADQIALKAPADLKDRLAATERETADVPFREMQPSGWHYFSIRCMFLAQPIRVGPSHCIYRTIDGRNLWGMTHDRPYEEAPLIFDVDDFLIEHRPEQRTSKRVVAKESYYARRNATGVERGACENCGGQAKGIVSTDWKRMPDGEVMGRWMEACDECGEKQAKKNRARFNYFGLDPDEVTIEDRNGRALI